MCTVQYHNNIYVAAVMHGEEKPNKPPNNIHTNTPIHVQSHNCFVFYTAAKKTTNAGLTGPSKTRFLGICMWSDQRATAPAVC